jgi:hypothetical protein
MQQHIAQMFIVPTLTNFLVQNTWKNNRSIKQSSISCIFTKNLSSHINKLGLICLNFTAKYGLPCCWFLGACRITWQLKSLQKLLAPEIRRLTGEQPDDASHPVYPRHLAVAPRRGFLCTRTKAEVMVG